jgi:tmRNA-binding protein
MVLSVVVTAVYLLLMDECESSHDRILYMHKNQLTHHRKNYNVAHYTIYSRILFFKQNLQSSDVYLSLDVPGDFFF